MTLQDWLRLQNGSDIRGVALEGIKGEKVNLTPDIALQLGRSFAAWLKGKGLGRGNVAVGNDSRISGQKLKKAFISGVCEQGMDVLDCGLASTPAMFMATINEDLNVTGAVMLTASHLPFNRNGFKFFTAEGGFDKNGIRELLEAAAKNEFEAGMKSGQSTGYDFISVYSEHLVNTIRESVNDPGQYTTPLQGMKIIVDAGNGAGGFFASKVLEPLGADISGSQFLQPDGRFPNHVPNPEDKEAMDAVCEAVVREKADLGIIFDTDVDRAALVDSQGNAINRNDLIALISTVILEEHPGSTIVTDSITSAGLKVFIEEKLKGVHHRFKRGYKNVINEAIRLNGEGVESWLAIETSGHAALRENYFLDDGAYLVAKLLVQAARMNRQGRDLGSLIADLEKPAEEKEYRLKILGKEFAAYGTSVLEGVKEEVMRVEGWEIEEPNFEGLRVKCLNKEEDGWFLLRMSLHDPVMPLNIESNRAGGVELIAARLRHILHTFDMLDTSVI